MQRTVIAAWLAVCIGGLAAVRADVKPVPAPAHLPGEVGAEDVLNGVYPWPKSPAAGEGALTAAQAGEGLAVARLHKPPAPGVHPRVLLSPEELPDLRKRLTETTGGRAMMATLRQRTGGSILKEGAWEKSVYDKFAAGDVAGAVAILDKGLPASFKPGHYQPNIPYALTMEAFDAMVSEDAERGKKVAAAVAGWAAAVEPAVDSMLKEPLNDDVWRVKVAGPSTGVWTGNQGLRDLLGNHLMGYAYDFSYNYMNEAQRAQVRRVIAKVTNGRLWMGARLPHHFRNWNWIMVGMGQPLLALAIEGEEGYDPRVYKMGVEIAQDYLTYGISPSGCSTEAVGYTQFGFVWGTPFIVAATRRGDMLLTHPHHRAMLDWYVHSMEPAGGTWLSHGDGGDTGPAVWTLSMWRYFFPDDAKSELLWQNFVKSAQGKPFDGLYHIIEPLVWCSDRESVDVKPTAPASTGMPTTWFDAARSSLIARSGWGADDALLQFECRTDSVGASHEHADRGSFTFSALGRTWARDYFRSIETRHHQGVLIDGQGQGYWPGPGKWIGMQDAGWAVSAVCDMKEAYDWFWPKQINAEDPASWVRFDFPRWANYRDGAKQLRADFDVSKAERDTRPAVVAHWKGFEAHDPRMWDEDGWPIRMPHNPVQKAFRSVTFVREGRPYLVVVDDIRKDAAERLYEWVMMPGANTEMVSVKDGDIVLCDATVPRDAQGVPKPPKGTPQLLVRVLDCRDPASGKDLTARPSFRLESFERKDALRDGRSFGMDKRLVIASRSAEPGFKILLYPFRAGEALPKTTWDAGRQSFTLTAPSIKGDLIGFEAGADGRTRVRVRRDGAEDVGR